MTLGRPALVDLSAYVSPDRILFLEDIDKAGALTRLAEASAQNDAVTEPAQFMEAIFEREEVSSTGIGGGIAVPHAKLPTITDFVISVGVSSSGIPFSAKDNEPVRILVMIAASDQQREAYLKVLATVAGRLKTPGVTDGILAATTGAGVIAAFLGEQPHDR